MSFVYIFIFSIIHQCEFILFKLKPIIIHLMLLTALQNQGMINKIPF